MSKFYDYNASTGTWYEEDYDHQSESIIIHTKQDVQPILDKAKAERNSGINDKIGKDFFFSKYATIPATTQVELRQKGLNIFDKSNLKRVHKEIEQNYPYLKTTNLKHYG